MVIIIDIYSTFLFSKVKLTAFIYDVLSVLLANILDTAECKATRNTGQEGDDRCCSL